MKRRRRLLALIIPWLLIPGAFAQWVNVSASHIQNGGRGILASGQFCVQPVDNSNKPLKSAAAGNSTGPITTEEACTPVADGTVPGTWPANNDVTVGGTNLAPTINTGWASWSNPGTGWSEAAGTQAGGGNAIIMASGGTQSFSETGPIAVTPGAVYTFSAYADATYLSAGLMNWSVGSSNFGTAYVNLYWSPGQVGRQQAQFVVPAGVTAVYIGAIGTPANGTTISSGHSVYWQTPLLEAGFSVLADTSQTAPLNLCYRVTVRNSVGAPVYTNPCYQPTSASSNSDACTTASGVTSCNYDAYAPLVQPLTVTTAPRITSAVATGLATGAPPTVTITGNPGVGYSMAFGIPAGPAGPTGPSGSVLNLSVNGTALGNIVTLKVNGF